MKESRIKELLRGQPQLAVDIYNSLPTQEWASMETVIVRMASQGKTNKRMVASMLYRLAEAGLLKGNGRFFMKERKEEATVKPKPEAKPEAAAKPVSVNKPKEPAVATLTIQPKKVIPEIETLRDHAASLAEAAKEIKFWAEALTDIQSSLLKIAGRLQEQEQARTDESEELTKLRAIQTALAGLKSVL